MRAPADPRPNLSPALDRLLRDLGRHVPALEDVDTRQVLCVAGAAHGVAAASVRGLCGTARQVRVGGADRHWEITLRPPFFLSGHATARLSTLLHELLHIDGRRPGALLDARRHARLPQTALDAQARACAKAWLARGDTELLRPLAHHGEVLVAQWRRRPVASTAAERFTGRDLFLGPVLMRTPKRARGGWW